MELARMPDLLTSVHLDCLRSIVSCVESLDRALTGHKGPPLPLLGVVNLPVVICPRTGLSRPQALSQTGVTAGTEPGAYVCSWIVGYPPVHGHEGFQYPSPFGPVR